MANLHNICRGATYTYTFGYLDDDYRLVVLWSSPNPPRECGICGCAPVGYACYHICPNSIHFYTPEQERYDEANYDPSEYFREGGFGDPEQYHDEDDPPICYMGHTDCYDNHTPERLADEADWEQEQLDVYRSNPDGTVTLITPSGGEHTYLPDDLGSNQAADAVAAEIRAGMLAPSDTDDIPF